MTVRRSLTATLLALSLFAGACSNRDDEASAEDVLAVVADEVIIPSYRALGVQLIRLGFLLEQLCTTPSTTGLDEARAQWRDTELAWQSTRAGGVGPAVERRLMADVGFRARPDDIEALLAGDAPVDVPGLAGQGAAVRGLNAVEVALFAPGSAALTTADGARRCTYAHAATDLAIAPAHDVEADWTGAAGYRRTFVEGMDGDPQSSVEALVNELTFRLQQIDDQGLRALAAAESPADVPANRREGPAAFGIGSLRGVLGGIAAIVHGPEDDGLVALVRARSADTADRLERLTDALVEALGALPDSIDAAFADRAALATGAEAASELKVLVGTEVASQLGVTIGFSDADGDS